MVYTYKSKQPRRTVKQKVFRKKNNRSTQVRSKSVLGNRGKQTMVNKLWASSKQLVPDRYLTKLNIAFQGFIPTGSAAVNIYDISLNSLLIPFNGGFADITLADNGSTTLATLEPAGFSTICSATAAYQSYRVTGVKVKMVYQPQSINDTAQIVFLPFASGGAQATNSMQASAEPHSRTRTCNSNNMLEDNIIEAYYKINEISGVKKEAVWMEDDFKALYNASPVEEIFINIFRANLNNAVLNNNVAIQFQMVYYVQFENPQTAFLNT